MDEITPNVRDDGIRPAQNIPAGQAVCFLGGGAYDHFIPTVVDVVASRGENYTAYTPYQAEASQGTLQAVFEYQTMMPAERHGCRQCLALRRGFAVAEAVLLMALGTTGELQNRSRKACIRTPAPALNLRCQSEMLGADAADAEWFDPSDVAKAVNDQTVAVIAQSPNFFGTLEEMKEIGEAAPQARGAIFIAIPDPIGVGCSTAQRLWR
ncbi:MAG: hypothetical protein U0798_04690 [Gemmataceae bacterium]